MVSASLALNDSSQVNRNTASGEGGGIYNDGYFSGGPGVSVAYNIPDDMFSGQRVDPHEGEGAAVRTSASVSPSLRANVLQHIVTAPACDGVWWVDISPTEGACMASKDKGGAKGSKTAASKTVEGEARRRRRPRATAGAPRTGASAPSSVLPFPPAVDDRQ